MMTDNPVASSLIRNSDRAQLQIYARELGELFLEEREQRQRLDEWNTQLSQGLRDMLTTSRQLQAHISQRFLLRQAYHELIDGLDRLAENAEGSAQQTEAGMRGQPRSLREEILALAERARSFQFADESGAPVQFPLD